VVSCGVRLSEVGFSEFRKPQVAGSIPVVGSRNSTLTLVSKQHGDGAKFVRS
jgi:hypothetical protein